MAKMTLQEKLAAARAGAAPPPKESPAQPEPEAAAPEAEPQAPPQAEAAAPPPRPAAAPKPAPTGKKLSLAEKLAAARAQGGAAPTAAPAAAKPAAAKAAPAAAKPASERALPPLEKMTDPKDLAEALRRAGAEKQKAAAATRAAEAAKSAARPATTAKKVAESKAVPPKPSRAAALAEQAEPTTSRRGWLSGAALSAWIAAGWATFVAGLAALNVMFLRFMFPNVLAEPPSTIKVGLPSNFDPGQVNESWKAQWGFWIVRSTAFNGQDIIYALSSICTHLGCPPNWLENEQKFKCPCHGSGFYITGINFEGPAPRPLERYKVTLSDDGQIVVDKSQKFQEELGQWSDPDSFIPVA